MEPILEGVEGSLQLFNAVDTYVTNDIWIGKMSKARERVDLTHEANRKAVEKLKCNNRIRTTGSCM
jgi:hypothetical protein